MEKAGAICLGRKVGVKQDEWMEKTEEVSETNGAEFSWNRKTIELVGRILVAPRSTV